MAEVLVRNNDRSRSPKRHPEGKVALEGRGGFAHVEPRGAITPSHQAKGRVEIQGHRGFGDKEPHNTIRAFRAAGAHAGTSSVEFDVQRSADGHLVVSHGAEVGGSSVPSQSLAELREADLGQGERVPLLADVVDVCMEEKLVMNVELKTADVHVIDATLELLRAKGAFPWCRISSFHRLALQHVMDVAPELPIGALYNPSVGIDDAGPIIMATPKDFVSWFADHKVEGDSVNLRAETITQEEVSEARRHGKQVMVWCACMKKPGFEEIANEYRRLISLGADVICANSPELLSEVVASGSS